MISYLDADIVNACKTLFGLDAGTSPKFLLTIRSQDLKTAFRKRAKETHPDLFTAGDPNVQRRQAEMFRVVNEAYDIMRRYCERRDRLQPKARRRPQRTAATPSFDMSDDGWRFKGELPKRRLEIGRYLYYRGCIPYHVLIRALAWQMRQRPPVGMIARSWGWLSDHSVRRVLAFRTGPHLFGERAMRLGLLTAHQARVLVAYQRTLQQKLGRYFVENGYLRHDDIEHYVDDLRRHNARFPLR